MTITKEKVTAKLIKGGFNAKDVENMVNEHFDYAVSTYKTLKTVCECITIIS